LSSGGLFSLSVCPTRICALVTLVYLMVCPEPLLHLAWAKLPIGERFEVIVELEFDIETRSCYGLGLGLGPGEAKVDKHSLIPASQPQPSSKT
jgi:hypothetical protein